jgi:hypothetical protein
MTKLISSTLDETARETAGAAPRQRRGGWVRLVACEQVGL